MTERQKSDTRDSRSGNGAARKSAASPAAAARRAVAELAELLGREPEGVVELQRTDDGWCIGVEVVEVRRIPDTADVIAEYEIDTDRNGRLRSYHRRRRYSRGQAGDVR